MVKGVKPADDPVLAEALKDSGVAVIDQGTLRGVSTIALDLANKVKEYNSLVTRLENLSDDIRRIEERELPAAMLDANMRSFQLADGTGVSVGKRYLAGIKVENRPNAFKWLRDHNHQALIKAEVVVPFAKGDVESADLLRTAIRKMIDKRQQELTKKLQALGPDDVEEAKRLQEEIDVFNVEIGLEQSVHWQTLRAWVKEQVIKEEKAIEDGELDPNDKDQLLPRELLGIYVADVAEVGIKKLSLKKE
jgi:hypothetical protein